MNSLRSFWDAFGAFVDALGSVSPIPLAIGLALHLLGMTLRGLAWRNIIAAALPGRQVDAKVVLGGLFAGIGLNGIVPARGGDVLKLFLIHTRVPGSTYPMLISSLVPETTFNAVMAVLLLLWAWQLGVLPSAPELPGISAFELSWAARYPEATGILIILVIAALAALAIIHRPRLARFWSDVADGFRIFRDPPRYLRTVVTFQAGAWTARVVSAWFFLDAFGIDASVRNALIVVMVQGISSTLPFTPGGLGPKQALLVVLFSGDAARSTVLAFSVGMEVTIVAFQFVVGLIAAAIMLRGFHIREALAEARRQRAAAEGQAGP
ncbi:MAG: flippase-like domain-containing protein [Thermoleophilia bacterium]|nr:flippase-like domain-containing protein [Thermoleophilia bacterium]